MLFFTSHWCDELTSKEITNHFQEVRSTNKVLRYMSRGIARIVWGIYVDRFVATVGNFKPLTIVQKLFILDVCGVPDHEKILGMHTTKEPIGINSEIWPSAKKMHTRYTYIINTETWAPLLSVIISWYNIKFIHLTIPINLISTYITNQTYTLT